METYRMDKAARNLFLRELQKTHQLTAPIKEEVVKFETITDPEQIDLSQQAYFPLKEHFFRKHETLFQFKGTKLNVPAQKIAPKAFFGLRKCDLNAIKHQDDVFMKQSNDPYYKIARQENILLGYHCGEAPSPYCFCESLNLRDFFDLMFYEREDHYLIEVGSDTGKELVLKYRKFFIPGEQALTSEEKIIKNADRLEDKDLSKLYDHKDWKKGSDICLSCAACTNLCPTCYCFEIHDEVKVSDPTEGERKRTWSSCQVKGFTRVAGDHVFRDEREDRFKHRIFHQLEYFKEKHGVPLCVGCGRCISGCPTRIDFVDIINKMK